MPRSCFTVLAVISVLIIQSTCFAQDEDEIDRQAKLNECLINAIKIADGTKTVDEIRNSCEHVEANRVKKRVLLEKRASSNPFAILPHKPNYLLPLTVSAIRDEPYETIPIGDLYHDVETKFQVSLKYNALDKFFFNDLGVQFAFTATSWWQSYNGEISAPFRETNYEPEIIFNYNHSWKLLGLPVEQAYISLNHQSNGQTGVLSRSWNRVIGGLVFAQTDDITWGLRGWFRIPEKEKADISEPKGDDNPNIEKYIGYGEIGAVWVLSDDHTLDVQFRNNLRKNNKGSIQLGWSFPINNHLLGYIEYFNGYGESLIYYNQHTQRLGIGVKLTNWL